MNASATQPTDTLAAASPGRLTERDLAMFTRIRVPLELLEEAHIGRVTNEVAREQYGIKGPVSRNMAGVVFPYFIPACEHRVTCRVRRDHPEIGDGKPKNKYVSAYGDNRHLYFPPQASEKLRDPATPIVLVEAEKSALALTAWATRNVENILPVATGGCWSWRGRIGKTESTKGERVDVLGPLPDLAVCDGRTVYVMLDSNAATNPRVQAARNALVKELKKRGCTVKVCALPQVEGVNGPDDLIGARGDSALRSVLDNATAGDVGIHLKDWPEPEPLRDSLPDVAQFDLELMPESFRPLVRDVAERMQVPMDFPAVAAIVTLAGVTNRRAVIQPKRNDDSWIVVPNLWGGIIAPPGMLKSPVIASMTKPARDIEKEWREEHANDQQAYEAGLELHEEEVRAWKDQYRKAANKGETRPSKPESSLTQPTLLRLLTSDATFESLHAVLAENPAGLYVLRDELTGWLAGLERPGREQERSFYLECWDGNSSFTIDRIGRGNVYVPHACISLLGGIQPAPLRDYMAAVLRDGRSNDGLMQRFQLLVWPDAPHDRPYLDRKPDTNALEYAASVYRLLANMDAANPLRLQFSDEAQSLFEEFITDLERRIFSDEVHPAMQGHLSKYRSLMPSLALLFALANGRMDCVPLAEAQSACDWCEYLETHARRVYASQVRPEHYAAIVLSRRLAKGWKHEPGTFTVRDVYRNGWEYLDDPETVRKALLVLQEYGWVAEERAPEKGPGRPSETYLINPRIGRDHVGK